MGIEENKPKGPKELQEQVTQKLKEFKEKAGKTDEQSEFTTTESIGFWEMCWRHADCSDKLLWWCGFFASSIFGSSLPAFCLIWGEMMDSIGGVGNFDSMKDQAFWMGGVGIIAWIFSFVQITFYSVFAENIVFKCRVKYYEAAL